MQEELVEKHDPYCLQSTIQNVPHQKIQKLVNYAKHYITLEKKFKAEPFFSRQEYYIISSKWLKRWKVFVGYEDDITFSLNKYLGCGTMPTANEDIVETKKVGNFNFTNHLDHLNIILKPDLQEGKDYELISKEMAFSLSQCEYYQTIRIARRVVNAKEGQIVQIYPLNISAIVLSNQYCRDVETERIHKTMQVYFQYSLYSTVQNLIEDLTSYVHKFYSEISKTDPMRVWVLTLKEKFSNITFLKNLRQRCKANSSFSYQIYLDGELLEENKKLIEYNISNLSQFVFELKEKDQQSWMLFNQKTLENSCPQCKKMGKLVFLCSCKNIGYCSNSCKSKDKDKHKYRCPNDAQSQTEEQTLISSSQSRKGKTGLNNLGNTSFMNSGFQCISHIRQLSDYFLQNKHKKEINLNNPLGTKGQLSTFFAQMVQKLWFGTESSYSPNKLKKAIGRFQPMFSGYGQHDSSQFVSYLLDGLHEDLNRVKSKPYVEAIDYDGRPDKIFAQQAWQIFTKRNQSIIVDLMYGQHKSIVSCLKCNYQSIQFDPFLVLSLPLTKSIPFKDSKSQGISIEECFDLFKNKKSSNNDWYCPKCKQFISANIQMAIYKAPKILMVVLKRAQTRQKNNIFVYYPLTGLDLTKFILNPELPGQNQSAMQGSRIVYDLFGVSNHHGTTSGGHYTSYCRNLSDNEWYLFDDSKVTHVKDPQEVVSQDAYVLYFRRRE